MNIFFCNCNDNSNKDIYQLQYYYEAISKVKYDIKMVEDEIAYSNNFLKPYLNSEYSDYFLAHKSNILLDWEFIVRFQSPIEEEKDKTNNWKTNMIETPQQSRQHFIKSKIKN